MNEKIDYEQLEKRIGRAHLRQRLDIQMYHSSRILGQGLTLFHFENLTFFHAFIHFVLRACGLFNRGNRNACDIQVVQNPVRIKGLPKAFSGYQILQISDLHLDLHPEITEALISSVEGVNYDLCVLTGDFRAATYGDYLPAMKGARKLLPRLKQPVYGVLGNHDFIEEVPILEDLGVKMLLNESALIERDGSNLILVGLDDAHYYQVDNFHQACEHLDQGDVSILLSHSPETYRQAASFSFDYMLSGHTHGGQICLPGGIPVLTNGNCPRRLARGPWKYRHIQGYTSRGAGCSAVPVRFCCPPEITIHTLLG